MPPPLVTDEREEKKKEMDPLGKAYDFGQKNYNMGLDMIDLSSTAFLNIKNQVRRNKIQKLSEFAEDRLKWKWNPTKVFKTTRDWARSGTKLSKWFGIGGTVLSGGMVVHEVGTNNWDAHTIIDGTMVVVAAAILITAAIASAPITGTAAIIMLVIAGYGVVDYTFDAGEHIDSWIGRDSGLWD